MLLMHTAFLPLLFGVQNTSYVHRQRSSGHALKSAERKNGTEASEVIVTRKITQSIFVDFLFSLRKLVCLVLALLGNGCPCWVKCQSS